MNPTITFGAFLATCREASGKTQAEVGAACAITPEAVCLVERGRRKPSFNLVLTLADALQIDRGLLSRFALQSRAPEFYSTLGLVPVEQEALESAYPRTVPADILLHPEAPVGSPSAPPAEGPLTLDLAMTGESTPQAC